MTGEHPPGERAPGGTAARPWKGLDTSRMPVFLGYDQIERMVAALLVEAAKWRPDEVVGIARGGIVPAAMAAGILALPLSLLAHDKLTGAISWIGPPARGRRILLVDDCCSTGTTLWRAQRALRDEARDCLTLVVVHDPDVARQLPDLSHPMRDLFRLPWERGEATPTGRAAKASGRANDLAAEAPFIGLGLDETLLARIKASDADLPVLPTGRAVLISTVARSEWTRIEAMLAATAYRHAGLDCPETGIEADRMSIARYKAEAASRFGCTHFIECDAEQAIAIAARAPHLIVTWWSLEAGKGWVIGAAAPAEPK